MFATKATPPPGTADDLYHFHTDERFTHREALGSTNEPGRLEDWRVDSRVTTVVTQNWDLYLSDLKDNDTPDQKQEKFAAVWQHAFSNGRQPPGKPLRITMLDLLIKKYFDSVYGSCDYPSQETVEKIVDGRRLRTLTDSYAALKRKQIGKAMMTNPSKKRHTR